MSELQVIQEALALAGRRRRGARALRGMGAGLFWGALLALAVIGLYHLVAAPLWIPAVAFSLPVGGALLGALMAAWRKPDLPEVARWVDDREHLQERLSTALEVAETDGAWRDLVITDAAGRVRDLDPRKLLPLRLTSLTRWAAVVLAITAGLGFVPEYRSQSALRKQADQANIKQTGQQLAALARQSLERRQPALPPTEKALESVATLGDQFTKVSLTRGEAVKDLSNAAEKLKEQLREFGKDPALRRLEQAARNAGGGESKPGSALQKEIESLQKQLGTPVQNPEAVDKLKKEVESASQMARNSSNQSGGMSESDRQKLRDSLSALSRQAQDLGLKMPQLDDAIQALAANQTDRFLKDLEASLTDLEKLSEMSKSLAQLQQQASQAGKDLPEQLKLGQPEEAQSTLQKMVGDLKAGELNAEQLKKLMDEVSRAVDPAGKYGKTAEHLKEAAKQLSEGQKQKGAESLAAAAKELEKLAQQLADAQQLQAAMEAVQQASACIGSGQCWRPGRQPGYKPGGKPGSGVGTWAEEGAEWNGESTAGWDNSGVNRPDEEARGNTDRGPATLSDALTPTKVRGQFSPGGQMPSITLKGVSIKGQSSVAYEEAVTAAQSDAQSALSQEKVPRAYQGAVRDYFDDLKK